MFGTVLSGIFRKIISEIYKSKIEDLEKRLLAMEQRYGVIDKIITDNERKIENLETRLFKSNLEMRKMEGLLQGVLIHYPGKRKQK